MQSLHLQYEESEAINKESMINRNLYIFNRILRDWSNALQRIIVTLCSQNCLMESIFHCNVSLQITDSWFEQNTPSKLQFQNLFNFDSFSFKYWKTYPPIVVTFYGMNIDTNKRWAIVKGHSSLKTTEFIWVVYDNLIYVIVLLFLWFLSCGVDVYRLWLCMLLLVVVFCMSCLQSCIPQ